MVALEWDKTGERLFETGVDHGVLYPFNPTTAAYDEGVAWNGLVTVTESPSGAEANPQYADNIKYLNLFSAEEFGATIEAFTYPDEFMACDGTAVPHSGLVVAQQSRRPFGFSYRTLIGNDVVGTDFGEQIHLVYNAMASPSEKARSTINDSPEAATLSWEVTTTPIPFPGLKPTAHIYFDSRTTEPEIFQAIKDLLYGTASTPAKFPTPEEILELFAGDATEVTPVAPTFVSATNTITIPSVPGVSYAIGGTAVVAGDHVIEEDVTVTAAPDTGYVFPSGATTSWAFTHVP